MTEIALKQSLEDSKVNEENSRKITDYFKNAMY